MRSKLVVTLALFALVSCVHTPPFTPGPHLTLAAGNELPPPTSIDQSTGDRPYRIGPFDKLSVAVFGVPDLSQTVQADGSGRIALPLAGVINAQGKTTEELAQEIAARLRGRYVRDPQVTVNLEETVSQVITVDGQVQQPGLYPVVGRMTLMRAIATARGTTEFAHLQDVVVFRTVGQRDMAALYNLEAIRRGMYPDPEVFASDVVVVGDSPARRLFRDIIQVGGIIATPIIAVIQRL